MDIYLKGWDNCGYLKSPWDTWDVPGTVTANWATLSMSCDLRARRNTAIIHFRLGRRTTRGWGKSRRMRRKRKEDEGDIEG